MISVAIANFNGAAFLRQAVASALAQRGVELEILIVDDRSTDDSWAIAQQLAREDDRVRCWQLPENRGPGGARNLALGQARGRWLAVLDNDDLIHPDRLHRLVAMAEASDATMIADDLIVFDDAGAVPPTRFLKGARTSGPQWITLVDYLDETVMFGPKPNLGFLKPVFRLDFLRANDLSYDERLRIAEDDDLILRALLAGARYRLIPEPLYFYRKHGMSISHRLSSANADRMMAASERLRDRIDAAGPAPARARARREVALRKSWGFSHLRDALIARDAIGALRVVARTPGALLMLYQPIGAALARAFGLRPRSGQPVALPSTESRAGSRPDPLAVLFISRQRLVGATNGSSAYLLALAQAVRDAGMVPHLLQPSPTLFGRTPFFRLGPEMAVFETITIRAAIAIGRWRIVRDPAVFLNALRGIASRLARRIGLRGAMFADRKAPYSISAPWTAEDLLHVARHGRGVARIAIADYIFQTDALPYLLDPDIATATVMHDLFSARAGQFADDAQDSVAALSEAAEIELLGRSDAVIAIQAAEAAFVGRHLPKSRVLLAPMALAAVDAPQPGDPAQLLFVGSNTAPNVYALKWFVAEIWPRVRATAPQARLKVAGTVAAAFDQAPTGVEMLGLVPDLVPLYRDAGVVISPLVQGTGLKIKLVEAMARGKAIVATTTTLQGFEHYADDAVLRADDAAGFADAILRLIGDDAARAALAARALAVARRDFGPDAAFAEFRGWLTSAAQDAPANRQARMKSISK